MHIKRLGLTLLIIVVLLFGGFISCSPSAGTGSLGGGPEFEVIRQAADAYMNSGKLLQITAQELYDSIMTSIGKTDYEVVWYDPLVYINAPFIVDVRIRDPEMPELYFAGHIPGSIHIPWRETTDWRNLKNLPEDRQIVVVSSTGQIGAEITAIYNILGYNAVNLMWGMTGWTSDNDIAPGRYEIQRDTVWDWGGSYRAVCPISEPTETYHLPSIENTESDDEFSIILAAADAYLTDGDRRFSMSAPELFYTLYYEGEGTGSDLLQSLFFTDTATQNPYTVPFFLDVREDETYANGHLCGTLHIHWKEVFKAENLMLLPPDRQILVTSDTGHVGGQVTALLNLLGYDAINLKWGISGWSLSLPSKDVAPDRFDPKLDCIDADLVQGFKSFLPCPPENPS